METRIDTIKDGTVTTPRGFHAGAAAAGIKEGSQDKLDLGILFSQGLGVAVGLFTTNRIKSAPVVLSQERLKKGRVTAVVINSGCANASTGQQGLADAEEMASLTAKAIGVNPEEVLIASTGVIGQRLPMERIREGLNHISLSDNGGHELARAMMTTDTIPKETAITVSIEGLQFAIGGVVKGSGMIHPNMATLLCFLTTDAAVEPEFLRQALRQAADVSFNMVSIDGDTSPSDTLVLLANGMAENPPIASGSPLTEIFQQALDQVCIHLAKAVARDGEGATKLLEVTVNGAASQADAALAARTIVSSPLWKAAVYGRDPNWGRVVTALGRSGAEVEETRLDLCIGDIPVLKGGTPEPYNEPDVVHVLERDEVPVTLELNMGTGSATAWGCDLTEEYVTINSQYTT
jgi:glutamate N-acetyltransferase/amino-acid N-acetyltransferase